MQKVGAIPTKESTAFSECLADVPDPSLGCIDLDALPQTYSGSLLEAPSPPIAFARRDVLSAMAYSYGFAVADFDRDGRSDISFFDSYVEHTERSPAGVIGYVEYGGGDLKTIVPNDPMPELPHTKHLLVERQVAIDVNADGLPDIVGVVNSHDAIAAYINPGNRTERWERRLLARGLPNPINIAVGDMDLDGDPDLLVNLRINSDSSENQKTGVFWLENPDDPAAGWSEHLIAEDLYDRSLVYGDYDGDTLPDILVNRPDGGVVILQQNTTGRFEPRLLSARSIHGHFGTAFDFDRNGAEEFLQPIYYGLGLFFYNPATGRNARYLIADFDPEPVQLIMSDIRAADMDGDGRMDIVFTVGSGVVDAAAPARGGLYMLRQAKGRWELSVIDQGRGSMVGLELIDMNSDGNIDIVANTENPLNVVTIYLQTGQRRHTR